MAQSVYINESTLMNPGDAFQMLSVTTLNFTATNDAFEQGKLAYAIGDYDQAVKLYTCALEALQKDLASVIYVHRAAAYEMQNKFEQAVQDGLDANPCNTATQPDSYLTLGSALFLHDQLRESVATYKRGIEVVPELHPQHGVLVKRYHQTLDLMEKRNQWMAQLLPFEVLSNILTKLSIQDRARLGMTCRFWNKYIFEKWPYMWESINTDLFGYPKRGAGLIDAIRGDQVRHVYAQFEDPEGLYYDLMGYNDGYDSDAADGDGSEKDMGTAWVDAMCSDKTCSWKNVKTLSLTRCNELQFKKIPAVVKNSLQKLTLHGSKESNHYGLRIIAMAMNECSNLQEISNHLNTYTGTSWFLNYIRDTAQISDFKLTSLSLSWPLVPATFTSICQCLPALTSLAIDPETYYNYAHILEMVINYLPALEVLHYTMGNVTDKMCSTFTSQSSIVVNHGLKMLVLSPPALRVQIIADNLAIDAKLDTLFQRSHRTLEALDLNIDLLEGTQYTSFQTLARLGAPSLHEIRLYAYRTSSIPPQVIGNLLSSCSSLVTIKINGLSIGHVSAILDATTITRPIQQLHIHFQLSPRCYMSRIKGLKSFFERTRHINDFSLNSSVNDDFTPTDPLIIDLARAINSSTVRKLNLQTFRMTKEQMYGVLTNMKNSQVRTLKICVAFAMDKIMLGALMDIQCLTHLILYDHKHWLNENDVCRLLERWERPQMLVVEVRYNDPKGYIKGYIPDLATMRPKKNLIDDPRIRYSIVKG